MRAPVNAAVFPFPLDGDSTDLAPRLNMRLDLWSLRIRGVLASIRRRPAGEQEPYWFPWIDSDERWTK